MKMKAKLYGMEGALREVRRELQRLIGYDHYMTLHLPETYADITMKGCSCLVLELTEQEIAYIKLTLGINFEVE